MKPLSALLYGTGRRALIVAALSACAGQAMAERPLSMSFQQSSGNARIILKWADGDDSAPGVSARISDQVLILEFDEPVSVNLNTVAEGLPSWAVISRVDSDSKSIRVGLQKPGRVHLSTSADLAAVDLLPEDSLSDPPDIVSPLIAQREREARAKRVAASPPPPIEELDVRGSHSGESSRVNFYWPGAVSFRTVSEKPGETQLLFNRRAKADLAYVKIDPPPNLAGFSAENTDKGYLVTIRSKDSLPITTFATGQTVTVDISPKGAEIAPEEAISAQLTAEGMAPAKAIPTIEVEQSEIPEPGVSPIPPTLATAGRPISLVPVKETVEPPTAAQDASASPPMVTDILGGPERVTRMTRTWTDAAPASGVTDVRVRPLTSGAEFIVTFAQPAPAAVFAHNGAVWAVFAVNTDLKIDQTSLPTGFRARALRDENAAYLRIEAPKGLTLSAESQAGMWTVRLAPTATRPERFLKPERRPGEGGRTRLETLLSGAAGIVWLEDPLVGEEMAAIVAYGPVSSLPSPFESVEVAMPTSAHGLAIIPKADNVTVTLEGERAVATTSGRSLTAQLSEPVQAEAVVVNPAFIDFATWGGRSGEEWFKRREELERAASIADPETLKGSAEYLELARFYVGHDMALEALGVLAIAADFRPDIELDAQFLGVRGAASVMAHRLKEADEYLSKGPLRGDPSAALWRGVVAAERGDWPRAVDYFRASRQQAYAYTPKRAAQFASYFAEAAFNTNDFDTARREAELAIEGGEGLDVERARLVLAKLSSVIDGPEEGYRQFEQLADSPVEPIAVRAELGRLELAVAAGRMNATEAASELESLRFRWRGDDVEMTTVGILADQYMQVGRFREALMLAKSTALRDATAQGARELRIKLTDYFRQLFLDGQANRLDPIQALALFYEFSELTPVGADGDTMIRRLSQRLVAFDLLEPAAQLLQHQVDNRMRGIGKAALAVDLATIYLLDKRPDRALVALNSTRQPSIPRELAYERRKLEAAAYRDLGRFDHVVELMEPLDDPDARALLADAYMRNRDWTNAAETYLALLPEPGATKPSQADFAFKGAIAARMSNSAPAIARFRPYASVFTGTPNAASFDLITAQSDIAGTALSEAARRLADAPKVDAFSEAMKARFAADRSTAAAGGSR